MSIQVAPETQRPEEDYGSRHLWAGLVLVAFGLLMFAGQFIQAEWVSNSFMLVIALILLVWGVATRHPGPIIAGGIVGGIGLGILLVQTVWVGDAVSNDTRGAVFLLAFALGWVSITVLTALFTSHLHWWPLVPGGVLGLVGLSLVLGDFGKQMLVALGTFWPLILVAVGVYLLWRAWGPARITTHASHSIR